MEAVRSAGAGVGPGRVAELRALLATKEGRRSFLDSRLEGAMDDLLRRLEMEGLHPTPVCSIHGISLRTDPYTGGEVCTECHPRYWA